MKITLRIFRTRTLANEWAAAYVRADSSAFWNRSKGIVQTGPVGGAERILLLAVDQTLVGFSVNKVILDESLAP